MGKSDVTDLKALLKGMVKRSEEWARTPEGLEHELRLEFSRNLAKTLRAKRMTNTMFCEKIGMKSAQFSRIIQGDENITLAMVARISGGLGVHPSRLFRATPKRKTAEPTERRT